MSPGLVWFTNAQQKEQLSWIKKYKVYQFVISASGHWNFYLDYYKTALAMKFYPMATHEKAGIKME